MEAVVVYNDTSNTTLETAETTSKCFVPEDSECSLDYITQAETDILELKNHKVVVVMVLYVVCLCNNITSILVFSQTKYENRLVIGILRFYFVGNITFFTLAVIESIIFNNLLGSSGKPVCRMLPFITRTILTFITWILAVVTFLRMIFTLHPRGFADLRKNQQNVWRIPLAVLVYSVLLNIATGFFTSVMKYCRLKHKVLCHVSGLKHSGYLYTFVVPLAICVVCVIVITASNRVERKKNPLSAPVYSLANRVIISSTTFFVISTLPFMIYKMYFRSNMDVTCNEDYKARFALHIISSTMLLLGYSLDCTVHLIVSPPFRRSAIQVVMKILGREPRRQSFTTIATAIPSSPRPSTRPSVAVVPPRKSTVIPTKYPKEELTIIKNVEVAHTDTESITETEIE